MENKQRKKRKTENIKDLKQKIAKRNERDLKLSEMIFGGREGFLQNLNNITSTNKSNELGSDEENSDQKNERKAVWQDEDDNEITVGNALKLQQRHLPDGGINDKSNKYADLLKHKFISTVGTPKWASLDKEVENDSDEEILKTCGHISDLKSVLIPKGIIQSKKVTDLNAETYSEGPIIKSVLFHPSASAALVAGLSGVASLYMVDGKKNSKLHSVAFERYPIHCAKFINDSREILFGSQISHMFSYDLETVQSTKIPLPHGLTQMKNFILSPDGKMIAVAGRFGEIHLLETSSKERIAILKQESDVTALTFNINGKQLFAHGMIGHVTVWDMDTKRVIHRWYDDGCIQGSSIAASPSGQFIATGSFQGAVNVYDANDLLLSKTPMPQKTILNLTTQISCLEFNATSELLAFSSECKENAVKLLHLNSGTVYSNFPGFKATLNLPQCINFSPHSGYLAAGNNKSIVSLYRLKHYGNY